MAIRTRKTWKPQRDGQYVRQLGWKRGTNGKLTQPKFRLGTDPREAKRREIMLTELWEHVEQQANGEPVCWPLEALQLATEIAREGRAVVPKRNGEPSTVYAHRMVVLSERLPGLRLVPADAGAFQEGVASQAKSSNEFVAAYENVSDAFRQRLREAATKWGGPGGGEPIVGGPTLHEALRDHIVWLKAEYSDANSDVTPWGKVRTKQAELLLDRHEDLPLARLDHDAVEAMVRFWRQRPTRKGSDRPVARKTAEHEIAAIKFFLRWLSRSPRYAWKKPESLDDIRVRVDSRAAETRRQVTPEDIFTLDELTLLNRYATPFERCLLLLGINCGFSRAEIATLTVGEVFLRTAHEPRHREILGFKSTADDSFVKRYRRKTGVYGEFILFPQTVEAVEWALARRRQHPGFGPEARLLVNRNGQPLDKPTAGGNPNQQIPNRFAALIRRIQKTEEGKEFIRRPFKMLRKTAGDLVRRYSDGEVAAVFHCRGQAVRIDDLADAYTTRPFGKVFHALRSVEEYLEPIFAAAGDDPFSG
jgi:integrase